MSLRRGLYKPKGRRCWYYKFEFQGTPYHGSTGCETRSAAEIWLRDFRDGLARGTVDSHNRSRIPTLIEATNRMVADPTTGHSESHQQNVLGDVMAHMEALHHKPLDEITTHDVKDVMRAFLERKNHMGRYNTPGGANHVLRSLGSVMGWAEENEIIDHRNYRVKAIKQQEVPKTALWIEELKPFLDAVGRTAPPDARDLIILEMGMGLRESEARHAMIEHTNLQRMEHTPFHPVVGTKGGEAKARPIPEWTRPHLERMIAGRRSGLIVPGNGANGAHGRNYTLQYVKLASALIGKLITPHRLRNTYATLLSAEGAEPKAIQEALGHKTLKTTLIYIVAPKDGVRKASNQIGEKAGLGEVAHISGTRKIKHK